MQPKKPHEQGISEYMGSRLQHDHRLTERHPGHTAGWRLRSFNHPLLGEPPVHPRPRTKPGGSAALTRCCAPQARRTRGPGDPGQGRGQAGGRERGGPPRLSAPPSAPAAAPPHSPAPCAVAPLPAASSAAARGGEGGRGRGGGPSSRA